MEILNLNNLFYVSTNKNFSGVVHANSIFEIKDYINHKYPYGCEYEISQLTVDRVPTSKVYTHIHIS